MTRHGLYCVVVTVAGDLALWAGGMLLLAWLVG